MYHRPVRENVGRETYSEEEDEETVEDESESQWSQEPTAAAFARRPRLAGAPPPAPSASPSILVLYILGAFLDVDVPFGTYPPMQIFYEALQVWHKYSVGRLNKAVPNYTGRS